MAAIIGVIQAKGGVGRSTITTNLAGTFSLHAPTVLIDCDLPQGTSSSWFALRQADLPTANLSLALARDCRELVAVTKQFFPTHQYIFIDGPPRLAEMTRAILMSNTIAAAGVAARTTHLVNADPATSGTIVGTRALRKIERLKQDRRAHA